MRAAAIIRLCDMGPCDAALPGGDDTLTGLQRWRLRRDRPPRRPRLSLLSHQLPLVHGPAHLPERCALDRCRDRRGQSRRTRARKSRRRRRRLVRGMTRMGDKIAARGRDEERRGHRLTAASCFMRATRYYQTGERFIQPRSERSMAVYATSVKIFKDAAAIIRHPRIESVEVPYDGTSLPALLVHPEPSAAGSKPASCMVFFDGFDVTKELQYGYGVPDLAARGIGCLIVDGPGNGESVRFRNLPLIAET